MANVIIMPRQGQSVESCIIAHWEKQEGDFVKEGDLLFTYETDKTTFGEQSKYSGTLLKILAEEGDDVPVLESVAIIGDTSEDISEHLKAEADSQEIVPQEQGAIYDQTKYAEAVAPASKTIAIQELVGAISPRARTIANNQGLDYSQVKGTGPNDRIIERDILTLSKTEQGVAAVALTTEDKPEQTGNDYEDRSLSTVRKAIAKSMHHSLTSTAQLTHSFSFDATSIIAYRQLIKQSSAEIHLENITYNDMVLFAVSRVLKDYSDLNAHFLEDKIRYFNYVNLGMAVDTPRGLLVPTLFKADTLSLNQLATQAKTLAESAKSGAISPDLLQNASITVSNLGIYGVEHFTPVINPPQVAIIGVNNIQVKFKMIEGQTVPYQAMGLSLTYDHRAVDGAPASRFMQALCKALENFTALLAK